MNRELFRRMKVCTECGRIYGFWHYQSGHVGSSGGIDYYQKCGCKTAKPDMPTEGQGKKKWRGFDFNETVTLCYCCGQDLLLSGSKWSVWFCEKCKERVIKFNSRYQMTIIPIGRHSIMSGYQLSGKESQDKNKVQSFVKSLKSLFERMGILEEWRKHIISHNLKSLGYSKDITLVKYLSKVRSLPERSVAFRDMCKFFRVKLGKRDRVRRLSRKMKTCRSLKT
jgi:hypothetical protein